MNTHTHAPDSTDRSDFNKLLSKAETAIAELRKSYDENGSDSIDTRIAIGLSLVPLNILYEDAYADPHEN